INSFIKSACSFDKPSDSLSSASFPSAASSKLVTSVSVSWLINQPSKPYTSATSINLSIIGKLSFSSFNKNLSNHSILQPFAVCGKNIVPKVGTPFLCAASITSALGGTIIPSPEDPPQ